jgi:uncharacterized protein YqeY
MSLQTRITDDLKAAMLAGQQQRVLTLRGLKSSLLYVQVADGTRGQEMPDETVLTVLAKESKKRQESADLYSQGGNEEKSRAELEEKAIIDEYLPDQLSEEELEKLIDTAIHETGAVSTAQMGQVIAAVRQQAGPTADGAAIARLVKARLGQ